MNVTTATKKKKWDDELIERDDELIERDDESTAR